MSLRQNIKSNKTPGNSIDFKRKISENSKHAAFNQSDVRVRMM